jgi:hypothetical protein
LTKTPRKKKKRRAREKPERRNFTWTMLLERWSPRSKHEVILTFG